MKLTEEILYSGVGHIPDIENLEEVLSWQPKKEFVKEHDHIKGWMYLPIQHKEFLLDRLFGDYRITVKSAIETKTGCMVVVNVQTNTKNHDGIGAVDFHKDLNASMGFPMAKTFAISDACDNIGVIFGRNLNRLNVAPKKVVEVNKEEEKFFEEVKVKATTKTSVKDLEDLYHSTIEEMGHKEFSSADFKKRIDAVFIKRKVEIK